jgi:hypothetical protein
MTRTQTVLVTTAMILALPLATATAQTSSSGIKCGPVAFSAEKMAYTSAPCTGVEVSSAGSVGATSPTAAGSPNSSSMTKAEMKGAPMGYAPAGYAYAPMQQQAVMAGPSMAAANDQCGPGNVATIRDEYGRRYNCRGDRIR